MTDVEGSQRASTAGYAPRAAFTPENSSSARDILRAVVTMSPLPMVLTDPHQTDNPIVFHNRAFSRLTGYAEEEVLGRNCRFLQGTETDPAAVRILRDAVAAKREVQVDLWNYRKDGTSFWNSMFVGPVYGRDSRLLYYFGSQVDATSRREIDEARARAQRMDTLGSMAAGIAHEVNNLMTVVLGTTEGLKARVTDEKLLERLGRIDWAARATGTLTQQMLTFAGRQGLEADVIDLSQVVQNFDRLLHHVAETKHKIELNLEEGVVPARVDVGQLELALINLVRNAIHASPDSGKITVATASRSDGRRLLSEISVADQGAGMAPEVAAKATEPFFTTKPHGQGTGLGLSMVAGFCKQSGGEMSIETELGKGTRIRLVFPRADLKKHGN